MKDSDCKTCNEYSKLSRRRFLGLGGGLLAAAAMPGWLPRVALADSASSSRDILVSIFLRGGCDGLSLCVPYVEDNYYSIRPTLSFARPDTTDPNRVTDLDGFFGLPPAMTPLLDAYNDGNLLFVHAAGSLHPTRSHFEAMHFMEVGVPEPPSSLFTGWLGRHLMTSAPTLPQGILRAIGMGIGLPRSLVGGPQSLPIPDLDDFDYAGDPDTILERRAVVEELYATAGDPLQTSAMNINQVTELLAAIDFQSYLPAGGATYPDSRFGYALKSTAALIKADTGVETVAIDFGGWDTHSDQQPKDGWMYFQMQDLAQGLAAFHRDLFTDNRTDVLTLAMSEFGRNALENGSFGTDHGHGNVMMLLGGAIAGGRVLTQWPGLAPGQLYQGQDLDITIDYRDVVAEIVDRCLGNSNLTDVFPDPSYTPTYHQVVNTT